MNKRFISIILTLILNISFFSMVYAQDSDLKNQDVTFINNQ